MWSHKYRCIPVRICISEYMYMCDNRVEEAALRRSIEGIQGGRPKSGRLALEGKYVRLSMQARP